METFEQLNDSIRKLQTDIRLEVIIADLLEAGVSIDDVDLLSNSLFHRSYHRDIEASSAGIAGPGGRKKLRFVLNRQGLYDQLPEDLFHQPGLTTAGTDKAKTLQELRDQEKTEDDSRRFFLPIEHEFYRQRVRLENEERKFLFDTSDNVSAGIFDLLWDLPQFLDEQEKSRLGLLMPLLHRISGNIPLMEAAMESVTGESVTIMKTSPRLSVLADTGLLGETVLGKTSVLGGSVSSFQATFLVKVTLTDVRNLADWLEAGKKRTLYEFLCTLLMPFDADVTIAPALGGPGAAFRLEEAESAAARLNFTTNI